MEEKVDKLIKNKSAQFLLNYFSSQDSSLGIAKVYGQDKAGAREFSVFRSVRTDPEPTQPLSQCVLGALSPGVKQPGSEADHTPQSSAEVINGGDIPPLPRTSS
jgi:hypothetical protein